MIEIIVGFIFLWIFSDKEPDDNIYFDDFDD